MTSAPKRIPSRLSLERHALAAVAQRIEERDARRVAVEILARHEMREAGGAHGRHRRRGSRPASRASCGAFVELKGSSTRETMTRSRRARCNTPTCSLKMPSTVLRRAQHRVARCRAIRSSGIRCRRPGKHRAGRKSSSAVWARRSTTRPRYCFRDDGLVLLARQTGFEAAELRRQCTAGYRTAGRRRSATARARKRQRADTARCSRAGDDVEFAGHPRSRPRVPSPTRASRTQDPGAPSHLSAQQLRGWRSRPSAPRATRMSNRVVVLERRARSAVPWRQTRFVPATAAIATFSANWMRMSCAFATAMQPSAITQSVIRSFAPTPCSPASRGVLSLSASYGAALR